MKKQTAVELNEFANDVARRFSKTNREQNWQNETFTIKEIIPTSDHTACVVFKKDSGKLAAFFFYYIPNGYSKGWRYFVPTDTHIAGMRAFEWFKMQVERTNFKHNFNEV